MKHKQFVSSCLVALSMLIASCGAKIEIKPVSGTIDEPLAADSVINDSTQTVADSVGIDLYEVQQALLPRLGYTTEGEDITLYIDGKAVSKVTNTIADMGGFDDDAIWIGEKMSLENSDGGLRVRVVPGVKFVVGLVLYYENMPAITATIMKPANGKLDIADIKIEK